MCITIQLVEDETSIRAAYCCFFSMQPDLRVVAEAGDGLTAVEQAIKWRPDVVLMDIRLPELDGIEATRRIHKALPKTRILALSVYDNETIIEQSTKAGAWGFVTKAASNDDIAAAIRDTMLGKRPILRCIGGRIIHTTLQASDTYQPAYKRLTSREREVLLMIADGRSTEEIAGELGIGASTVATFRNHLIEKLNLHTTAALTRYAIQEGLTPMKMFDTDSD